MKRLPIIVLGSLLAGACADTPRPTGGAGQISATAAVCRTESVTIAFDFEGASQSRCAIEGERSFSILVTPEHAPPINPSAWYAFRYKAKPGPPVVIELRYLAARHRYVPKLQAGDTVSMLSAGISDEGRTARFAVPPGAGIVAGQELFLGKRYNDLIRRLSRSPHVEARTLGSSHDGRAIKAIEIGDRNAPYAVILLGRAHPPEVTGALAMEPFLERIVELFDSGAIDPARFRFLAVPLLNPDGVARGHWRSNVGATDLNRDWGPFAQPETRSVRDWLARLPTGTRPVALLDFHSTQRDVFYTIPAALPTDPAGFTDRWLDLLAARVPDFGISREPGHETGSGVSKNWFYDTYGAPAVTFEIGDETERRLIDRVGRQAADAFAQALGEAKPASIRQE
ncbi:M14 family metallopeptidase [Altererythrobacter aquiaggeris]|uniref:M14 family metallopeptidase n=1 Tax=Aestuarierythrobacter aquiaggeris TaxID=1898396 RepID=UPI00301A3A03